MLLHCMGESSVDIAASLNIDTSTASYQDVVELFSNFVEPSKNEIFERHKFFSRCQHENESVDNFVTELRVLAERCEFGEQKDNLIRDKIVL